jgi:hypothetical protein
LQIRVDRAPRADGFLFSKVFALCRSEIVFRPSIPRSVSFLVSAEVLTNDTDDDGIQAVRTRRKAADHELLDGTGIPLRAEELVGRTGKQPDGSAKTGEVKLCTIWSAESLDAEGTPIRDEGSVTYSAALESASALDTAAAHSPFAQRVWREAARRRFCQAARTVVLGDGALWIWNIADEQFPEATQIVDRYHAKEYLSDLGKALYGLTAPRAAQWAERRKEELDTGKFPALLTAIRRQVPRSDLARRCLHYFKTNRERMRYPEFHAQGLCTSSGVVEAGCKVAIGTRLKRAGMHWTKQGSNAIIALRCSKLSGRFQDFWERRSERRAA